MPTFYYTTEQLLPPDIDRSWDFFSSAENLALITPPSMDFKILTALNGREIYEGLLINYTVKPLLGLIFHWETEICKVNKPFYFTDRQLKGPYKLWEHTHTFIKKDNGVLIKDEVKYQLPFGIIGNIIHALFVRKIIEDIFIYRKIVLNQLFESNGNND
jgi:ligand-binding SRPBCC domain-containing protein